MYKVIPLLPLLLACTLANAQETLLLSHWWVSPGERSGIAVMERYLGQRQLSWQERAIPGSGTARYGDVLRQAIARGEIPTASQVIGHDIQEWAALGLLQDLTPIAEEQEWDEIIPVGIQQLSKYRGRWVAAPINAHSTNWLWVNAELLQRIGGTQPDSWEDLLALLEKAKAAGIIPLAIGRESWEHTLLFESVAVGTVGAEYYRKAFIEIRAQDIDPARLQQVFQRMSLLRAYLDPGFEQRNWNQSTDLMRQGKALLQVQGTWVGGEFTLQGLQPGRDYQCFRFPDTQGVFLFNSDQYMLFKDGPGTPEQRHELLRILLDRDFQRDVNLASGAAPARVDVPREAFNACGQGAINDMRQANLRRAMLGSIAMGNANPSYVKTAIYDVVSRHLRGQLDDAEAARLLYQALLDFNSRPH
ncbi:carbohydrate ABC transporter substrate-binding protein [Pseudomonas sp. ABC1]|uniref:ABC transporter substrate-binding protein n=1 Tax=Pseudomonas sp. ABC1 TaxID=2748080 RepID=UPI0015C30554|nr:ABC transporter substrate-binding protein [Pseudomonas sp. ABC1]QLF91699.1 carbohydrate ABC transporter substrate-binding protein [Pseudomonas sp. ABC1]